MRPTAAATNADAPPSGINPILVNASMKRFLRSQYDIAGQCDGYADAGGRSLHDGDHRVRQRDDGPDQAVDLQDDFVGRDAAVPDMSSALMPAPELKPRPAPPSRTTLTPGSTAACSIASAIPVMTGLISELRLSGRLMVTDNTPSISVTSRPATGAREAIPNLA